MCFREPGTEQKVNVNVNVKTTDSMVAVKKDLREAKKGSREGAVVYCNGITFPRPLLDEA